MELGSGKAFFTAAQSDVCPRLVTRFKDQSVFGEQATNFTWLSKISVARASGRSQPGVRMQILVTYA